jgi:hypothetical protein
MVFLTGIFATFILLDRRENSFCVPLERSREHSCGDPRLGADRLVVRIPDAVRRGSSPVRACWFVAIILLAMGPRWFKQESRAGERARRSKGIRRPLEGQAPEPTSSTISSVVRYSAFSPPRRSTAAIIVDRFGIRLGAALDEARVRRRFPIWTGRKPARIRRPPPISSLATIDRRAALGIVKAVEIGLPLLGEDPYLLEAL